MKNILVVVPHQDDEINLIGNCIDNIKKLGNIILVYTSLEVNKEKAKIRKEEAYNSCKILGINKENIIFLNYPDTPNKLKEHFFIKDKHKVIQDLQNIINKYKPEYIFGTDFDFHSDHRMASLALDEAIGNIIKNEKKYKPIVFKGFCYETAYYGIKDYKASKLEITKRKNKILSNSSYDWEERYSVKMIEKKSFIWTNKVYKALKQHKSQFAVFHAQSIINSDNVFWMKRTDNLLNQAILTSSSGECEKIRDFKVIDTYDIITENPRMIDYSKAVWIPEKNDDKPYISIKFKINKSVKYIILHGNPNNEKDCKVNYEIIINGKVIKNNFIKSYGKSTKINVNIDNVYDIRINFDRDIIKTGISEIEIFENDVYLNKIFEKNILEEERKKTLKDFLNDFIFSQIILITKIKRKLGVIKR